MKIGQNSALPGSRKGILQFLTLDRLVEQMKHSGIVIPPSIPGSPTGASPWPRRNLAVVPLIGDKRYYGEVPARPGGGYGPVSGNGPPEWRKLAAQVAWLPREPSWAPKGQIGR